MNPENSDGWEQLDRLTETYDIAIDVNGRIIGSYRIYALQSGERIEIMEARSLVKALNENIEIQYEKIL